MKQSKYVVKLTDGQRNQLDDIVNKGKRPAQQIKRARILLGLDQLSRYQEGPKRKYMPTQEGIAIQCDASMSLIYSVSRQFVQEGFDAAITRKKRKNPPIAPIVTGDIEARIIALACGSAPEGYNHWTLRLLESKVVELGIVDHISDTTIYRVLKKHGLNHI